MLHRGVRSAHCLCHHWYGRLNNSRSWMQLPEVAIDDANVDRDNQILFVTGGPGRGQTAVHCIKTDCRVLIPCPVGALIKTYKETLPPDEDIVLGTIHSSFRITRETRYKFLQDVFGITI